MPARAASSACSNVRHKKPSLIILTPDGYQPTGSLMPILIALFAVSLPSLRPAEPGDQRVAFRYGELCMAVHELISTRRHLALGHLFPVLAGRFRTGILIP